MKGVDIYMKHHKYYNTIWAQRDKAFYWDGVKDGLIIAAIATSVAWCYGLMLMNKIKEFKQTKTES